MTSARRGSSDDSLPPPRRRWLSLSFYGGPNDEVLLELEGVGLLETSRMFTSGAELGAYLHDVLATLLETSPVGADEADDPAALPGYHRFVEAIRAAIAQCAVLTNPDVAHRPADSMPDA